MGETSAVPQFTWDGMRQADGPVCLSEEPSPLDSQRGWGFRPLGTAGPNLADFEGGGGYIPGSLW